MTDEERIATLQRIEGRLYMVGQWPMSGTDVRGMYDVIPATQLMVEAVGGIYSLDDDRPRFALNVLRRAGLIEYDRESMRWART